MSWTGHGSRRSSSRQLNENLHSTSIVNEQRRALSEVGSTSQNRRIAATPPPPSGVLSARNRGRSERPYDDDNEPSLLLLPADTPAAGSRVGATHTRTRATDLPGPSRVAGTGGSGPGGSVTNEVIIGDEAGGGPLSIDNSGALQSTTRLAGSSRLQRHPPPHRSNIDDIGTNNSSDYNLLYCNSSSIHTGTSTSSSQRAEPSYETARETLQGRQANQLLTVLKTTKAECDHWRAHVTALQKRLDNQQSAHTDQLQVPTCIYMNAARLPSCLTKKQGPNYTNACNSDITPSPGAGSKHEKHYCWRARRVPGEPAPSPDRAITCYSPSSRESRMTKIVTPSITPTPTPGPVTPGPTPGP
eukprot:7399443-Pyramimonas_sp.AAC.1